MYHLVYYRRGSDSVLKSIHFNVAENKDALTEARDILKSMPDNEEERIQILAPAIEAPLFSDKKVPDLELVDWGMPFYGPPSNSSAE